jgi:hypothetical protein
MERFRAAKLRIMCGLALRNERLNFPLGCVVVKNFHLRTRKGQKARQSYLSFLLRIAESFQI